jgi:acyl carrier protein
MNRDKIIDGLRTFLAQETNFKDPKQFSEDADLIRLGVVDSLLLFSLIAYCEKEFNCVLNPDELGEDQVKSLGALAETVLRAAKQPQPSGT